MGRFCNCQFTTEEDWEFLGVVKEIDFGWCVVGNNSFCIPFCDIVNCDLGFEIIGNIHENPEFLK